MSQITRCPACATSFKVVADQLRISQGWVRCGQCKEVFDASAHLLPATAAPLLPDVSLIDTRPPPVPVARKAVPEQAWGGAPPAPAARPPAPAVVPPRTPDTASAAAASAFQLFPSSPPEAVHDLPEAVAGILPQQPSPVAHGGGSLTADGVLEVPQPTVPAFLSARDDAAATNGGDLSLEGLNPFAWSAPAPAGLPPAVDAERGGAGASGETSAASPFLPQAAQASAASTGAAAVPAAAVPPPEAALAGYELPFAQLREDEDLPLEPMPPAPGLEYPALEEVEAGSSAGAAQAPESAHEAASASPLPPVEYPQPEPAPAMQPADAPAMALVEDSSSPAAVLRPSRRKSPRGGTSSEEDGAHDEGEEDDAERTVSFVLAAQRKAFWRKPAVRAGLALVLLLSVLALALQVALQERDRLAAMDVRARPWLAALCARLHCEIAPQRQIADVVIDSSSFNKARGDSYQLALTIKSRAAIPLAMPAVELTLTDVQDQPVLRRVLLPADLGAPQELPARGEWSSSLSVLVTTGGARVAGYRLLAFYP